MDLGKGECILKRIVQRTVACLLLAGLAGGAFAETLEDVEKKLIEAAKKIKSSQYTSTMESNVESPGFKMKSKMVDKTITMRKGDKWLWRSEGQTNSEIDAAGNSTKQEIKTLIVSDGDVLYTVTEMDGAKQYMKSKVTPENSINAQSEKMLENLRALGDVKLAAGEKVDGKDCWVIEVVLKPGSPMTMMGAEKSRYFYDKSTGMFLKSVTLNKDGKASQTLTISDVKIDESISEDRFKFTPPPGVEVQDLDKLQADANKAAPTQP